jgi:hypothetical protein
VKSKTNIRYLGFRSTIDGGRLFDFCVSGVEEADCNTCFEIPAQFFTGDRRVRLQEGVGICYAKLKQLVESGLLTEVPGDMCLTALDMEEYREAVAPVFKRRPPVDETDRKIS